MKRVYLPAFLQNVDFGTSKNREFLGLDSLEVRISILSDIRKYFIWTFLNLLYFYSVTEENKIKMIISELCKPNNYQLSLKSSFKRTHGGEQISKSAFKKGKLRQKCKFKTRVQCSVKLVRFC